MLRYAHAIPADNIHAFLNGIKSTGFKLEPHWRPVVHLLNGMALVDCLQRASPKEHPKKIADILHTLQCHLLQLEKIKIMPYVPQDSHELAKLFYETVHNINRRHYTQDQCNAWAPPESQHASYWAQQWQ